MSSPPVQPAAPPRIASVDVYRGFVMFLLLAESFHLQTVSKNHPDDEVLKFLAFHQEHVTWRGCSLHDLIQPSFSFLVGVALPFSIASRRFRGQSAWLTTLHAFWRAAMLIFLGIFLRSVGEKQTNYTFVDTLTQIGLGYLFLFALGHVNPKRLWFHLGLILIGYWAVFAFVPPVAECEFDPQYGDRLSQEDRPTGFAAHWDKNTNPASSFDEWFLNLFPRKKSFTHNSGGYATMNSLPTLGTMILGLIAGGWLLAPNSTRSKIWKFVGTGIVLLAIGWGLDMTGICPSVKRIWTPAWVLFSGGWCFLLLGLFSALLDTGFPGGWAFPLKVIGANSIAAYVIAHFFKGFITQTFKTHFGPDVFSIWPGYEPLVSGFIIVAIYWLMLYWLYRRKIFIKI